MVRPAIGLKILLSAGLPPLLALPAPQAQERLATRVYELMTEAREQAGLPPLPRRTELELTALQRARGLADLPAAGRRGGPRESLAVTLRRNGLEYFRKAGEHVDAASGYRNMPQALFESWQRNPASWAQAVDPAMDSAGLAVVRAQDGWTILVVVLLQDVEAPADLGALEKRAIEAVNRERRRNGLRVLREDDGLSTVARRHSEDMATRDYFDHTSPAGFTPADRVDAAGITYRNLSENIQYNLNAPDAVEAAVTSWMESPGHRKNILTADFTHTGMGVGVDAQGGLYFTQLFLTPPG